jgi:hypothetical protein
VTIPIILPWLLQSSLEAATQALFDRGDRSSVDFFEAAMISSTSAMSLAQCLAKYSSAIGPASLSANCRANNSKQNNMFGHDDASSARVVVKSRN